MSAGLPDLDRARVRVRRALPSDRDAMLRMTKDTWGGNDYLPYAWDEWLDRSSGHFMAAVVDGEVVGLQRATLMPDGTAWLEGIRRVTRCTIELGRANV